MLRRVFRDTIRIYRAYLGVYLMTSHFKYTINAFVWLFYVYEADTITSNSDLKWTIPATFGDIIFADSAFERPRCIRSQFWYIMWLRMFYVRILHDFCKECICQHFWALNCCFWLYFTFYVTREWFEVLLIVQRVLRHTISTSKAWYVHTCTDLHIHTYI